MKKRLYQSLALAALLGSGVALANNKWIFECGETGGGCASCETSTCTPQVTTYTIEIKSEKQPETPVGLDGEACTFREVIPLGQYASGGSQPGVTSASYSSSSVLFEGVAPDYVKRDPVTHKPVQAATRQSAIAYSDLAPGEGFKRVMYPKSVLPAPNGSGTYQIPSGAGASSETIYRNPDYVAPAPGELPDPTEIFKGNLDIVHKQRHPQSGAWVTHTIRRVAPQNNNNWTTRFYLGDPKDTPSIEPYPYREITITRTANPDGTETTREITRDRDNSSVHGTLVKTSDLTRIYAFYKHGEPVILSETRHTGTGSELTTTRTYYHDSADQGSFNKPATMRRSDGQWANYTYQGSPVTGTLVTKTVSGWLDNPAPAVGAAPDENANRVVIVFEARNETGTIGREEKIQGVTVSRTWGERYKANSGELVEKTNEQRGSATLTTIRTGHPDNSSVSAAERGRLKSIQHPDGTVTLHRHAMQGDNRLETIDTGAGSLAAVTDGTRTVSTYTRDDVLIAQVTSDIASGIELSARQAIAFDSNDQPSRWAYDHNLDDYSETLQGCCGIDSTRSRDGVVTTYTNDGLKRPKTAISQGVTLTHTYGGTTLDAYPGITFPTVKITRSSGSLSLDQGTTVYDHAGNVIQQIRPDLDGDGNPEITTITRNVAARTTTTRNPDGGEIVQTDHADGQSKSTTGDAVPDSGESIAVGSNLDGIPGAVMRSTTTRPSGTDAGDQITTTYQAIGGLTLVTKLNGVTTATYGYDNLARPVLLTDGDGVKQHTAYNAKGEACRHATSRDGNDTIDLGTDTVSDTLTDIAGVPGFGPAIRSVSKVWTDANTSVITSTTLQSPDGTKSSTTTLGVSNPSTTLAASAVDRADGTWTDTQINPDGTQQVTEYSNWLPLTQSMRGSGGSPVLESATTGYDALRRPETSTDLRTAAAVTRRTAYHATSGLVFSITEDLVDNSVTPDRVTRFKYDNMGNRVETKLPDNSTSYAVFSYSGRPIISWGSQTYPTYSTCDEQGRPLTLRTNPALTPAGVPLNEGGSLTTWVYFANGQLKQKQDDAGKGAIYTYTNGGRLHTREWARGVLTTYGYYTTSGQPFTVTYSNEPAGRSTPNIEYTYDILGRQQSVTNGVAKSVFTYDPATLAQDTETIAYDLNLDGTPDFTRVLDRSNDTLGRATGFQLKTGTTIENQATYGYSATDGRLSSVIGGGDVSPPQSFSYLYAPNSSLLAQVTGPVHTAANTWEPTRDVLASKQNKVGTTVISQYDYTVNPIGQRTGVNTSGTELPALPSWLWGYDNLGQVTSADSSVNTSDRAYQYDAIGNRKKSADSLTLPGSDNYTSNALNQYSAVNSLSPSYDDDGNASAYPLPAAPTVNSSLTWDAENRLVSATVSATTGTTTKTTFYDAQSRRIAETIGSASILYIYDGWNCIAEYQGGTGLPPVLAKTRLWGLGLSGAQHGADGGGGLLAERNHTGAAAYYYPAYDGNGNVSEYLDGNGAAAAHFEYDPFGNLVVDSQGNAAAFPYRFSTKPQDATTGLYYYGYRWYDPLTGRWPSKDPIEEEGGINLYGFVGNDGVNKLDMLGMHSYAILGSMSISEEVKLHMDPQWSCGEDGEIYLESFNVGFAGPITTGGVVPVTHANGKRAWASVFASWSWMRNTDIIWTRATQVGVVAGVVGGAIGAVTGPGFLIVGGASGFVGGIVGAIGGIIEYWEHREWTAAMMIKQKAECVCQERKWHVEYEPTEFYPSLWDEDPSQFTAGPWMKFPAH